MRRTLTTIVLLLALAATAHAQECDGTSTKKECRGAQCESRAVRCDSLPVRTAGGTSLISARDLIGPRADHLIGKRWTCDFRTLAVRIGQATAVDASDGVSTPFGKSWEFALQCIEVDIMPTLSHSRWTLHAGLWLNWRNYRMDGRTRFAVTDEGDVVTGPYPEGARPKFSRVKIYSLEIPLTATYRLSRHYYVDFGPIFSLNSRTSIKTRYTLDDEKQKEYVRGIHANRFTVDLLGQVRYNGVGLYVKYSPCRVLNTAFAPTFSGLSAGFVLKY